MTAGRKSKSWFSLCCHVDDAMVGNVVDIFDSSLGRVGSDNVKVDAGEKSN